MSDLFFSYSRRDSDFVDNLIARLEDLGVTVWVDRGEILAGESWRRSIVEAIHKCKVFVIVLSPDSVKSDNVTKELTLAEQYNKRVLPLVAKSVEIPPELDYHLAGLHYQTFAEGDFEANFNRLIRALSATGIPIQQKAGETSITATPGTQPIQRIGDTGIIPRASVSAVSADVPVPPAQESFLKKVPIWAWAAMGGLVLLLVLVGLFSLFNNRPEKPSETVAAVVEEIATETPTPTETLAPTETEIITETPTQAPAPTLTPAVAEVIPPTITPSPTMIQYQAQITDNFGVPMVLVEEGTFLLGSLDGDPDEEPVVEVFLTGFYIDRFEVTNASYLECVEQGICNEPLQLDSQTRLAYFGTSEFANYPVIHVNWEDANTYCTWRGARLPSEAEWEKAARGPEGLTYPWGNEFDSSRANYCGGAIFCPGEPFDGYQDTAPVDAFESGASLYGAYQMAGNVNEWVADWFDKNYYGNLEDGVINPTGPAGGQERVIRGGSFGHNAEKLRSSNRAATHPTNSGEYDGFRCAKDLP